MSAELASGRRAKVEDFQRRHHVGLVTLVFTDVVNSTKLKQDLGDEQGLEVLERHDAMVRQILSRFKEGEEISTAGDSFFLVFTKPSDAVKFAVILQHDLQAQPQPPGHQILDRIGLHVGEVLITESGDGAKPKDLYGIQVDICARISALAQARQILMTRFTFDSARQVLKGQELEGIGPLHWMNHGSYRLKGVEEPLEICGVGEDGPGVLTPPPNSDKAQRLDNLENEPVLGWRPALEQVVPQTRWVLEQMLGEGSFGEVWLARHQILDHRRVFKFCFRTDRVRSLKREVTLFRVMKERFGAHPHIVGIQDVFFDEPPYYIVMDYAEGKDLRAWCEERGGARQVPLAVRLEIVAQVAEALQAAHDAGVIHRDVKPANILVSGAGAAPDQVQAKLTDFGIGQVTSEEVLAGLTKLGFTQTGGTTSKNPLAGTQAYMAPELIAGKPASTGSDVYALGVVLYQMLLGDFTAPVTVDWMEGINEPKLRKDVARCFAGNPRYRFPRIGQLAENLRAFSAPTAAPAAPATAPATPTPSAQAPATAATEPQSIPARDPAIPASLIDLSRFYNAGLSDDWYQAGYNLAALPHGRRVGIGGTEFDPRGIIQLGCPHLERLKAVFPQRVTGIPIRCKCSRFHFLHAAVAQEREGAAVGSYTVQYLSGREVEIPIIYGEDLRSWLFASDNARELKRATVAWTGRTTGVYLRPVRIFKLVWTNPSPDEEVASLDFHSALTDTAPFLIALTVD